jgi:hypothetical protein
VQYRKRIHRVRRSAAQHLEVRHFEASVAGDRLAAELEPILGARVVFKLLMRRLPGRYQDDAVQAELEVGLLSADQVTYMRRVEGPAEDADT